MTFLIGSIRPADVLITADGRCQKMTGGKVTAVEDDFRKIHPIAEHPLAVVHHGENLIGGRPVGEMVAAFARGLNAGNCTVPQVADLLREHAHAAVRARLKAIGKGTACGFWVVGFAYPYREAAGVEIFWRWEGDHLRYEERNWKPTTLVTGGSGQFQLPGPTSADEINGTSIERVRAYHKRLMDAAIAAKVADNPVGGHVHELRITAEAWAWTIAPAAARKR